MASADPILERLSAALGDRYDIDARIGEGGFAIVYAARDRRHDRRVALKVLRPELGASFGADRFVDEIRLTARLQHPHILPLLDSGEADGLAYYAMPFVAGESLRARLDRTGRLSLAEAMPIVRDVADALDYAARQGVAHRDVKPENILLAEGHAYVADFGVAKALDAAGAPRRTRTGVFVGTPVYASPEQLTGSGAGSASDLYSLACVLFEMLAGRLPFDGTPAGVIAQHASAAPPSLRSLRHGVPASVDAALRRALSKDPGERFATAAEFVAALTPKASPSRRARVALAAASMIVMFAGGMTLRSVRLERRARNEVLPEAARLAQDGRQLQALRLLRSIEGVIPDDPLLRSLLLEISVPVTVTSTPRGALVELRAIEDTAWQQLGRTPLRGVRVPTNFFVVRVSQPGYEPFMDVRRMRDSTEFVLVPDDAVPPDMVLIPRGGTGPRLPQGLPIEPFLLDRHEVTNRQYQAFVDAGGYDSLAWWRDALDLAPAWNWERARAELRDRTGRPGPATWSLGTYPEGTAEHPVGGVSWYEASAYCASVGKRLPTFYHWRRASDPVPLAAILRFSNFRGRGADPVGQPEHVAPNGTYDMAGNVKEWVLNDVGDGRRYLLGGGWNEADYQFLTSDAQRPWVREATFGIRCARWIEEPDTALLGVPRGVAPEPPHVTPADDATFELYRGLFAYDPRPVEGRVDSVVDVPGVARIEYVSFAAAYGDDRVPAALVLPHGVRPPYQPVVFFPGSGTYQARRPFGRGADVPQAEWFMFLVRTGRAVIVPVYYGSYFRFERRMDGANAYREMLVHAGQDLMRAIDYLETRSDIDVARVGYFGFSAGASLGPMYASLEPRLRTTVLLAGGLARSQQLGPEMRTEHYLPRASVPTLMINGRFDFVYPYETFQRPMFELLGTPPEHKLHCVYDTGHIPPELAVIQRAILDWFDRYLGPVGTAGEVPHGPPVRCPPS